MPNQRDANDGVAVRRTAILLLLVLSMRTVFAFSPQRRWGNAIAHPAAATKARRPLFPPPSSSSSARCGKPGWLEDAMDGFGPKQDDELGDRLSEILPAMKSGLAGFAIDPDLGFCAILVTGDGRFLPVVVSPTDRDRLVSAEAQTMVQLAGGLDLGTAILPPDLLARIVADEMRSGDEDNKEEEVLADLRPVVSLTRIDAVVNPAEANDPTDCVSKEERTTKVSSSSPPSSSSKKRDATIRESVPRVWAAIRGLPGLSAVRESQVQTALEEHAGSDGSVDRDTFSSILDSIRRELDGGGGGDERYRRSVSFRLVASVISGDSIQRVEIETANSLQALGLGLRYKVDINVVLTPSSSLDEDEGDRQEEDESLLSPNEAVLEKFPAFRPMYELLEDAKIMDGFIPSMFQQAKRIDNDMKA